MIANAIIKDGGLFILNVDLAAMHSEQEVRIKFEVIDQLDEDDIFKKAAGLLKDEQIDPLKFQDEQRGNAGWPDALAVFRKKGFVACGHFEAGLSEKAAPFSEKGNS
jgi:hypothetical protein